jgi:hypothetical protein
MNAKVIIVFVLTLIAIGVLSLFSFGPLSSTRKKSHQNPASLKSTTIVQTNTNIALGPLKKYVNSDVKENHYSLSIPATWQVTASDTPGSYVMHFSGGSASAVLQDVPDNTTLELFVLSQDEPKLKQSVPSYARTNYQQLTIHGAAAYQLWYRGEGLVAFRTYITGADQAALLSFTSPSAPSADIQAAFTSVIQSFQWETK